MLEVRDDVAAPLADDASENDFDKHNHVLDEVDIVRFWCKIIMGLRILAPPIPGRCPLL